MAYIIGIDVGGTHADGVLLKNSAVLVKKKIAVDQNNLSDSILDLLRELIPDSPANLARIHLSTTLCTNAIVNDDLDKAGMLIQAGPGMNPAFLECGEYVCFLDGAIDHRGHVIKNPDPALIEQARGHFKSAGIASIGIVTKFSHRNSRHEQETADYLHDDFVHISLGHRISGMPNFPRRVYTTWLNAALKSRFAAFAKAMQHGLKQLKIDCPCSILKADGGTLPFYAAGHLPCEAVHSGPSASIMGCLALKNDIQDAILLDIGGTTTDIAIFADGIPLLEPYGATIKKRPTLIRALNTISIGLGGDSAVLMDKGAIVIGPQKKGPPMAFGGNMPTPTDAMVTLGKLKQGDIGKAREAMLMLKNEQTPEETASQLLEIFSRKVKEAVKKMIDDVFSRPVFTVSALLERKRITPGELITVGGPARAMQEVLAKTFALPCSVPDHFEVANAIGSARARATMQATLYADTADMTMSIPETGCQEKISRGFTMKEAEARLTHELNSMAQEYGMSLPEIEFVERQELNTISGFRSSGKIISLKAQIRPGLEQNEQL